MVIASWIRRVDTIEFLKLWELINNENFKPTDFEGFKSKPGQNAFTISPKKWIELTNAIGLKVKSGRYNGGTYAHKDIALEFASWISAEVKLYIIKDGKDIYNGVVSIQESVTTSTCDGFDIPTSQLVSGNAQIEIILESGGRSGKIVGEAYI